MRPMELRQNKTYFTCIIIVSALLLNSCNQQTIQTVTVADFKAFIKTTGYVTDAEKYGWSIIQLNVHHFEVAQNVDWRCPDGQTEARDEFAVTQVSYNDAQAYADWAKVSLPDYNQYWELTKNDKRLINENAPSILPADQVNIVGNVWDITIPDKQNRIRLAGGSYLCNKSSCNGTSPNRVLYVDKETGNTHISFSVITHP